MLTEEALQTWAVAMAAAGMPQAGAVLLLIQEVRHLRALADELQGVAATQAARLLGAEDTDLYPVELGGEG